jgi:DNA primase large subunit
VLRALEGAQLRNKSDAEMKKAYMEAQKKFMPLASNAAGRQGTDVDEERRKDYISHFILRLAYCKRFAYRFTRIDRNNNAF